MARQAILQAEEFPEQRLAVLGELGKVDAALRPADRRDKRDRQDVEQLVPLCIPPPRVRDLSERVDQGHVSSSGRHGRIQISAREKPYSSNAIPLSIGRYLSFYNGKRPHSSLGGKNPDPAYINLATPILAAA